LCNTSFDSCEISDLLNAKCTVSPAFFCKSAIKELSSDEVIPTLAGLFVVLQAESINNAIKATAVFLSNITNSL